MFKSVPASVALLVLTTGLVFGGATAAQAAPTSYDVGFVFTADDANIPGSATITGYEGTETAITIPSEVTYAEKSYSVTTIGDFAFEGNGLISVIIPNSVTTIGDFAFEGNQLTSVIIPNSVTTIGDRAFAFNGLTSVIIPNSVTTIGDYAFAFNGLTSVIIPNSVTTIGNFAFRGNELTSVTIPNSVTTIGDYAFYGNPLTSVTIGTGVSEIGKNVFAENPVAAWYLVPAPVIFPQLCSTPIVVTFISLDDSLFSSAHTCSAQKVSQPVTPPERAGFTFKGWYAAASGGTPFVFENTTVSASMRLFAQWTENGSDVVIPAAATLTLSASVGELVAGSSVTVSANGLQPTAAYTLVVRSTPQTIASGNAVAGVVNTSGTLPAGLEAGWHTVTFSSTAADGQALSSVVYFKLSASGVLLSSTTTIPAELANTGAPIAQYLGAGVMLFLAGGIVLTVARVRKHRA
jgi:uncharacterized repeat protein (TIGR02543 family)